MATIAAVYKFTIADFPSGKIDATRLQQEIVASSIITALGYITASETEVEIVFKDALDAADEAVLQAIIAAHSGAPPADGPETSDGVPIFAIDGAQADKATRVAVVGRLGKEVIYATHDFTDPTSWYSESVRVEDEVLKDSGDGLTFASIHESWVDMTHGKVFDEDAVAAEVEHRYSVAVTVDDVALVERAPFETVGGDFDVDYVSGKVTFFVAQAGTVKATYSYQNGSAWIMRPTPGTILKIEYAEAQFSVDVELKDTIRFGAWGLVDVFAPQLVPGVPSGTLIELEVSRYKRVDQIVDEALGSFPVIPAIGGAARGNAMARYGFPFRYGSVRVLSSKAKMELRVSLESNREFGGERATATFYCSSEPEK